MDSTQFTKTVVAKYNNSEDELTFTAVHLNDKTIVNVQVNGAMDTTFDIPLSTVSSVRQDLGNDIDNTDSGIEPVVLMGEVNNIKLEIVATQIGKLMLSTPQPKSLILSIGSRWFGKGDVNEKDDFDKLMFVLANVKQVL
ncbi:proteasome chaperone 3 [[Candida] anglica]|uniref:Proteasome chaperone 3 n=1 Tax=[Candida] anglica TaxID=148631 RepID=A0ABP0ELC3_9ASCO